MKQTKLKKQKVVIVTVIRTPAIVFLVRFPTVVMILIVQTVLLLKMKIPRVQKVNNEHRFCEILHEMNVN